MILQKEELLKEFLERIKKETNPTSFSTWFNELKIYKLTSNEITFIVPMSIHKQMLGDNYYSLIDSTLFDITKVNYNIDFLLESEIS